MQRLVVDPGANRQVYQWPKRWDQEQFQEVLPSQGQHTWEEGAGTAIEEIKRTTQRVPLEGEADQDRVRHKEVEGEESENLELV